MAKTTFFPDSCSWCIYRDMFKHKEIAMPDKLNDSFDRKVMEEKEEWIAAERVIQELRGKYCYLHKREKGMG